MRSITNMCLLSSAVVACMLLASVAQAEVWSFDVSSEGENVNWVSPTSLDPNADWYELQWEITLLEVTVHYLFFDVTVDVTNEIPPEYRIGEGSADGPAPVLVYDGHVVYPEPPEQPGLEADLLIGLDAAGYGYVSVMNIYMGELTVEIPGFGMQTVDLERIRIAGVLNAEAYYYAPGDLDCDRDVDFDDINPFVLALSGEGAYATQYPDCRWLNADCDFDGDVDFDDINPFIALLGS